VVLTLLWGSTDDPPLTAVAAALARAEEALTTDDLSMH